MTQGLSQGLEIGIAARHLEVSVVPDKADLVKDVVVDHRLLEMGRIHLDRLQGQSRRTNLGNRYLAEL